MKKRLAKRLLALLTTAALFVGMLSSAAFAGSTATVTRLSGDDRYDTAYEVVDEAFSGSQYAVIASGTDYPDALSAAALAGALDAPVIITSDGETADTVAKLESLGTTAVYIVGGTSSVSEDAAAAIEATGITVSRIAGTDRTETSIAVAAEVQTILGDEASGTCFVAAGATYADALSASAYAYYTASPIFLTDTSGNITEKVLAAIEEGGYSNVVILGGENSVTRESAGSILSITGISATRIGGADRYETSALIAAWSAENGMTYNNAAVASGTNFADALSASSLCGQNGSVLLLAASTADDSTVLAAALKEKAEDISNLYIIGGTSSVSSGIYNMIADIIGANSETEDDDTTVNTLSVGAGASAIIFDEDMFPVEGFDGTVESDPYARVLLIEDTESVAIVSLELVNIPDDVISEIKTIINEATGIAKSNIWVHANHTITTPHAPDDEDQRELYVNSVITAVTEATEQAVSSVQAATMGIGTGTCDVNVNRDIEINGTWYIGANEDGISNKTMTIIRFDDAEGNAIGMMISYGVKPTTIDNAEMDEGTRQISSDLTGLACRMMEEEYDCPVMFVMPATGDQTAKEETIYYEYNEETGEVEEVELSVAEGIAFVQKYGTEMGETAIEIASEIETNIEDTTVQVSYTSFTWGNSSGDGEVELDVSAIAIGDELAFVGLKPETNAITELQLWEASPYEHTLIISFMDGDQKYIPDYDSVLANTWEAKRSGFAIGAAEEFVSVAVSLLEDLKAGITYSADDDGDDSDSEVTYETVEFGGITWLVLDEKDGAQLLLSENIIGYMAYDSVDGATTWEDSDLREYLNGDFYDETFTDEEKALILDTEVENTSNSKYGIAGGNDTTDKIFALSLSEAEEYLSDTDYLVAVDAETGEAAWWHLRSPGEATNVQARVTAGGEIDYHGPTGGVTDTTGGIRCAMWVSTE